jgi:glycosyltransferase involved in cell wall biosynthesis
MRPTAQDGIANNAQKHCRPTLTICHFTTAHTELKGRSFHREFLPLALRGVGVRYLAPVKASFHLDGIDVVALRAHRTRLRRILSQLTLIGRLLRQRANLYHFQDPELLPIAFVLKLIFGKRIVYDAYEDFPSMTANKAGLPRLLRPLAAKAIGGLECLAVRCFDGLTAADPFTLRRLAKRGSRQIVFYNFPNLAFFPRPLSNPKVFDIVYRGGLSGRAGTFVLLEALRLLAKRARPPRLLLIGYFDNCAAERALRLHIQGAGLGDLVEVRGRLDHERMAETLSEACIGVSPLQAIPKFMLNIPVKVFEYWACGLPVVCSDLPPIRPFFRNGEAGLLFPPESPSALAESVAWLLDHPSEAAGMGERGRDLVVRRFNNEGEVHKLHEFCARIAAN